MELLFVLGRIASASFANVHQKQLSEHHHPLLIVLTSYCVLALISLPFLFFIPLTDLSNTFWLNSLAAAFLDMAGTLFLVLSLSKTDLSIFGPLNAYKVVISALLALVFLHEIPSLQGTLGIAIIIIGSCFLLPPAKQNSGQQRIIALLSDRGVQYRFLSILLFSVGTLPLKTAVMEGQALTTTVFWCLMGLPLALITYLFFTPKPDIRSPFKLIATPSMLQLGGLIFMMQLTTLLVLSQTLIAYALALFQLSMVLQVFLGHKLFNEPQFKRRLSACIVMIIGSLLVLYV